MPTCTLQLFHSGSWQTCGVVNVGSERAGFEGPARFEYDFDYLDSHGDALGVRDSRAVSARYPLSYEVRDEPRWPAFLFDLIPSGAARRYWEARLGLPNNSSSDWPVLVAGASNPPGNLRVLEALANHDPPTDHPGFERREVLERKASFVEYARAQGAPASGSAGAGGDSPKFLLREDLEGRWHADAALDDAKTKACWLVKFPRSRQTTDAIILRAEAAYHRVAARLGVRTLGHVLWEQDCLFVPRFDRHVRSGHVERWGLESLASLAGSSDFGAPIPKEQLAKAVAAHVSEPSMELKELVLRDVLDVALGNTDNHARNTSVLKRPDGRIELAPLYDFAPMVLDREGIVRVCRWADGADFPDWRRVAEAMEPVGLDASTTKHWLGSLAGPVSSLAETMRDCGVPDEVIAHCRPRIERVTRELESIVP